MPVLFYTGVLIGYVTQQVTPLLLALAWAYVAVRFVHSLIHLSNTHIARRRDSFLLSATILIALWGVLLVRLPAA